MNFQEYYQNNNTYILRTDPRLSKIIDIVCALKPAQVLDIGCGAGYMLNELSKRLNANYFGIDAFEKVENKTWEYKSADITKPLPYASTSFNCVVLGEVIEHVPDPDFLLNEIRRVLVDGGYLVISTPNMVSWANRILVPLGIQPLFTETSSEINLGRYWKALGQGGKVQGHLKIFTYRSLAEILELSSFRIISRSGAPFFFPFPLSVLDHFFSKLPSLASNLVYVAQKIKQE